MVEATRASVSLLVEGAGMADIQQITVPEGSKLRDIVREMADRAGFPVEGALLFVEDGREPLDLEITLDERYDRRRVHHVHHASTIEVTVFYGGSGKTKTFSPSTPVSTVLAWAVGPEGYSIDPAIVPEMRLQLAGTTEPLPGSAHIGRYVSHHERALRLDLARGVIPNGGVA